MDNLDKKWNIHKVVQEAIKTSHLESAPETKERLAVLETNQQNMMDKLETSIQENKEAHQSLIDMIKEIENKLDKALETKANKWVENAMSWAIYLIMGIVLTALVYLVIKQ